MRQILEEHKLQGEEDQALEKRVGRKKAAAKKRATKKSKANLSSNTSHVD
jgi:condensin complex subunit 1